MVCIMLAVETQQPALDGGGPATMAAPAHGGEVVPSRCPRNGTMEGEEEEEDLEGEVDASSTAGGAAARRAERGCWGDAVTVAVGGRNLPSDASTCLLWCAVALGALVRGSPLTTVGVVCHSAFRCCGLLLAFL